MESSGRSIAHDLPFISTGHLPSPERIKDVIDEAYERFASDTAGQNSTVYPALQNVSRDLFGICVVRTDGFIYSVGDAEYDFTIMSVSKPFLFALICDLMAPKPRETRSESTLQVCRAIRWRASNGAATAGRIRW